MPEGTEIYFMKQYLNSHFLNELLTDINVLGKLKKNPNFNDIKFPCNLQSINQNGKLLWFEIKSEIDEKLWKIFFTFGLKGGFGLNQNSNHNKIEFKFQNRSFFFKDSSNFGSVTLVDDDKKSNAILKKRGYNLYQNLSNAIDEETFKKNLAKLRKPIPLCEFLLNRQNYLSGIGNVLKCEILYHAKLSPHRLTDSLSDSEIQALHVAINKVIKESIEMKGRTCDYSDFYNEKECTYFQKGVCVYQKEQDNLDNQITCEETSDKRKTYWVKSLQV